MSLILSGTDGLSDVDGTAATPAIRGTDANTGIFFPAADTIAFSEGGVEAMRLDSSGNLGLGVTPSAWGAGQIAMDIGLGSSVWNPGTATQTQVLNNSYFNNTNFIYKGTGAASRYRMTGAQHEWHTAPSGTAGNAITFTQAMTLGANGNLLIGSSTAATGFARLSLVGGESSGSGPNSGVQFTYNSSTYGGGAITTVNAAGGGMSFYTFTGNVGSESYSERARIDTSGNLLVGTTSYNGFGSGIQITRASQPTLRLVESTNTRAVEYGCDNAGGYIQTTVAGSSFAFYTGNAAYAAKFDSSGNLLVGKTSASDTTVGFTAYSNGTVTCARSSSVNGDLNLYVYSTGAGAARFYVGMGGTVFATNTTISAISDQRFKENIQDLDVGLNAVMALKPRKFDWKAGKGKDIKGDRGFIAQELEQVFPDLVDEWADPAPEGEEPYKSVRQDLIPVLVKAIQEQQTLITQLTARLDAANL